MRITTALLAALLFPMAPCAAAPSSGDPPAAMTLWRRRRLEPISYATLRILVEDLRQSVVAAKNHFRS